MVDPLNAFPLTPILSVSVPPGDYVLLQTVRLWNFARFPDQENGRRVECFLQNAQGAGGVLARGDVYLDAADAGRTPFGQITLHTARTFTEATTVFVACRAALAEADRIQVFVESAALTALRLDALFQQ